MDCTATSLSYPDTGYFSKLITDYISHPELVNHFFCHPPSIQGIEDSIKARQSFDTNREVLVAELTKQYRGIKTSVAVENNITHLSRANCYTITTAHQPAIFTGPLFFIYKIVHAIALANRLNQHLPQYQFVPVFYMGSEDADLAELGKIYLGHEEIVWKTSQTGAVGRMQTKGLEVIIQRIEGEFAGQPFGRQLLDLLKECYLTGEDVQSATFRLLDRLFAVYGLVILIPDNPGLKKLMTPVFEKELFEQASARIVVGQLEALGRNYKVQASPREINLFYLRDNLRGRIEHVADRFDVHGSSFSFSPAEIRAELLDYPERFSPNVILRGLFQETVLPNIIFIGGGGEIAYWLELKTLFEHFGVPYPVLLLRNSFLIVEKKWAKKLHNTGISLTDVFRAESSLLDEFVRHNSHHQLDLSKEKEAARALYLRLKDLSGAVDPTLSQHVASLESKALTLMDALEKKILRAEKKKFVDQQRAIHQFKAALFPFGNLQERIDSFIPYFAKHGQAFIDLIIRHSLAFEQRFTILTEK